MSDVSDTPVHQLTLRLAVADDLATLQRWDREPHLQGTGGEDWDWTPLAADPQPAWREWLIAERAGRAIGFLQIMDPGLDDEFDYWGPDVGSEVRAIDIWIGEPDCLRRGFGSQMMRQAIERCFAIPSVAAILIDPLATNTPAHRFYEAVGFHQVERRMFGDDDCFVYRQDRAQWRAFAAQKGWL